MVSGALCATDDLAAELGELLREGLHEAVAVGLGVVDRGDLGDVQVVVHEVGRERALDRVRGRGAEVGLVRARLAGLPVRALRQRRVGVGRGDLDHVRVVEDLLHRLGHAGVQRADHADDAAVGHERRGVLLTDGRVLLVVLGHQLEGDARHFVVLVRGLDGEVRRVLDAEAERRQRAGQRRVDADLDHRATAAPASAATIGAPAPGSTSGQGQSTDGDDCAQFVERSASHIRLSLLGQGRRRGARSAHPPPRPSLVTRRRIRRIARRLVRWLRQGQ